MELHGAALAQREGGAKDTIAAKTSDVMRRDAFLGTLHIFSLSMMSTVILISTACQPYRIALTAAPAAPSNRYLIIPTDRI